MTDEQTTQNGGESTTTTTPSTAGGETVVREGSRTRLDAATEISVKAIPFVFLFGLLYAGLALLGLVPVPTFGLLEFTLLNVLIIAGSLTGLVLFGIGGYMAIKWHHTPDYVHLKELDAAGVTIDEVSVTPQRWRDFEIRDDDGRTPPARQTKSGDTVYLCREVSLAENYIKPAGDLEDAPDDDQIIVSKAALKTYRKMLATYARNWRKTRGTLPSIKERIGTENVRQMSVSMEQSEHGGEKVEEALDEALTNYDAVKSEQDDQPVNQTLDDLINTPSAADSAGDSDE